MRRCVAAGEWSRIRSQLTSLVAVFRSVTASGRLNDFESGQRVLYPWRESPVSLLCLCLIHAVVAVLLSVCYVADVTDLSYGFQSATLLPVELCK